jgi:hypothetical protein
MDAPHRCSLGLVLVLGLFSMYLPCSYGARGRWGGCAGRCLQAARGVGTRARAVGTEQNRIVTLCHSRKAIDLALSGWATSGGNFNRAACQRAGGYPTVAQTPSPRITGDAAPVTGPITDMAASVADLGAWGPGAGATASVHSPAPGGSSGPDRRQTARPTQPSRIQAPQSLPRPVPPPAWKAPAHASRPASWRPRPPSTTPTRRGRPTWQASGPRSPPFRRPQARRASCPSAWPSLRPTPQRGPAGWRGASACS